jgi:2-keto-3-deoxy-L-fuconate dehydrogenase
MRLTGKVVLITNVADFMGPACVEEFAREGATLALHARAGDGTGAALAVARAHGREAHAFAGDLRRPGEADRVVAEVVARLGCLDVLVGNASHPPAGGPVDELGDEAWRSLAAALLDEPFFCLRAALRVMKRQGRGKVVHVGSAAGIAGLPSYAAYSALRAGVLGLTRAAGREVAPLGIQVNAIAQNFVENPTYFGDDVVGDPARLARVVRHVPAGRLARGEESARLAVYLASADADFFCGQVVPFAGGWV